MDTSREKIKTIKKLESTENYVYDISIKNQDPFFFANDLLVHNTDSCYFSAWPKIKSSVEAGELEWNKEVCVEIYNGIADQLNESFPGFMETAFNCPRENGAIIQGGRELIATKGLFIKKKRYGVLIYDLENKRLDVDGKPGKVKAMGLDLKRSDTPKNVQDFLSELLLEVLQGAQEEQIIKRVKEFKLKFRERTAWEKGTPKRVNNMTKFTNMLEKQGKANLPGHVRASINWNVLKKMNSDNYSQRIVDGQKVIVCKLKPNVMDLTSVAYPIDEAHLPDWFKELPFDEAAMENVIVDQKVNNLLGVLKWDLTDFGGTTDAFNSLFG